MKFFHKKMQENHIFKQNTFADLVVIQSKMNTDHRRQLRDGLIMYHNDVNKNNIHNLNIELKTLKPIELQNSQIYNPIQIQTVVQKNNNNVTEEITESQCRKLKSLRIPHIGLAKKKPQTNSLIQLTLAPELKPSEWRDLSEIIPMKEKQKFVSIQGVKFYEKNTNSYQKFNGNENLQKVFVCSEIGCSCSVFVYDGYYIYRGNHSDPHHEMRRKVSRHFEKQKIVKYLKENLKKTTSEVYQEMVEKGIVNKLLFSEIAVGKIFSKLKKESFDNVPKTLSGITEDFLKKLHLKNNFIVHHKSRIIRSPKSNTSKSTENNSEKSTLMTQNNSNVIEIDIDEEFLSISNNYLSLMSDTNNTNHQQNMFYKTQNENLTEMKVISEKKMEEEKSIEYEINTEEVVIITTQELLDKAIEFQTNAQYFGDGKFSKNPLMAKQMWTLHIGKNQTCFPVVFVLTNGKSKWVYKQVMEFLFEKRY